MLYRMSRKMRLATNQYELVVCSRSTDVQTWAETLDADCQS